MRIKLLLTALIVISIVLGNVLGGGTPIFALRGIWNEAQEDDIDDDNLVIEEDEDYAGEEFEKINDEDLQDALETPVDEVEDEDEEEDEEDKDEEESGGSGKRSATGSAVSEEELRKALYILEKKDIKVDFSVTKRWDKHYNVDVTLKNIAYYSLLNWEIKFPFTDEIEDIWNAKITRHEDGIYYIKNAGSDRDIEPEETVTFGMTVACEDNKQVDIPEKCSVTRICDEVGTEYELDFKKKSKRDNKVSGEITVRNCSDMDVEDWKLELETNLVFTQVQGAEIRETGDYYCYLDNKGYNADIPARGSVTFSFTAEYTDEKPKIWEYYLYEMTPPIDEEAEIRYEVEEDEEERDDEDFNTDEEYEAYLTVRKYYKAKLAMDAGKRKTKKLKNKKSAKSK